MIFRVTDMKLVIPCLVILAAAADAAQIGQTYEEVIALHGQPASRMESGSVRVLRYPRQILRLKDNVVVEISLPPRPRQSDASPSSPASTSATRPAHLEIAAIRLKRARAEDRVRTIVNQPAPSLARTVHMRVHTTQGAWYPEPAGAPDFANVDVRATQQKNYDAKGYLAAGADPGTVYLGDNLEYNPALAYYYSDRTVPKTKLTPGEMEEINALFRTIAECDRQLKSPAAPAAESATSAASAAPPPETVAVRRERTSDG